MPLSLGADIITVNNSKGIFSGKMVFSTASLVFCLVVFFIFIIPGYRNIKILTIEEALKNSNYDKKMQTLAKMQAFELQVNDVSKSDIDKINMFIPNDNKVEYQLSNLDNLAAVYRVKLSKMQVTKKQREEVNPDDPEASKKEFELQEGDADNMIYKFEAKGAYGDVMALLRSVENNIPFLRLNNIRLADQGSEYEGGRASEEKPEDIGRVLIAKIEFTSFYFDKQ